MPTENSLGNITSIDAAETPRRPFRMCRLRTLINWLIPVHTRCAGCGKKLAEPSRVIGTCQDCNAW